MANVPFSRKLVLNRFLLSLFGSHLYDLDQDTFREVTKRLTDESLELREEDGSFRFCDELVSSHRAHRCIHLWSQTRLWDRSDGGSLNLLHGKTSRTGTFCFRKSRQETKYRKSSSVRWLICCAVDSVIFSLKFCQMQPNSKSGLVVQYLWILQLHGICDVNFYSMECNDDLLSR